MNQAYDAGAVAGDAEAMRIHPNTNITAFAEELTTRLRTRLTRINWLAAVGIEDDPYMHGTEEGYRGFLVSTDGWEAQHVAMPGVPLEVVRAAPPEGPWCPLHDGDPNTWDSLLDILAEQAALWEMYRPNMLAFLGDVAMAGGPNLLDQHLSVDVDGAGEGLEPFWVPVGGDRLHVGMHGDIDGRESDQPVFVEFEMYTWHEAVTEFRRRAAQP